MDDVFADGNRIGQNPPASLAWFVNTGSTVTTSVTPGNFQLGNGGNRLVVGYLAPTPLVVGNGQSIALEITFRSDVAPALVANGFNLALFNSGGTRISGDFSGTSNVAFAAYDGYGVKTSGLGSTAGANLALRQRNAGTSAGLMSTSGDWITLASGSGATLPAAANVTYIATLVATNNGTSVGLNYTLKTADGATTLQSLSGTDASSLVTSFDTVSLYTQTAAFPSGSLIINRIKVSVLGAVIAVPPVITAPPLSQTATAGDHVTLTVSASGTAPLLYQWSKDGVVINGATGPSLDLPNVPLEAAGNYTVTVTNAAGSVTSAPATLTVNALAVPPTIITGPVGLTAHLGDSATFTVVASGSVPLSYIWLKNDVPIAGATQSSLSLTNLQLADAGSYTVAVSNSAGTAVSEAAALVVTLVAPTIVRQPVGQTLGIGMSTTLTVLAAGSAPLTYQWMKDGVAIEGATTPSLSLNQVQVTDAGDYDVIVENPAGFSLSSTATIAVATEPTGSLSAFNLTGFATVGAGTTGGGLIPESSPAYVKVTNALELANAVSAAARTAGAVKVIEIMNDLNLGWNEIGSEVQNLPSTPFRAHTTPKLHPVLLVTGMSLLDLRPKSGLTIFSAHGATIRHCNFNIKGASNIIVRNLKFDENWEWDELTKGDYDSNDWDFITLGNGAPATNIWIDHCTFTKAYDGILDQKAGTQYVTLSWCTYIGDDGATNPNSWVRQQINALEANRPAYKFYDFLRTNGFSVEDIVQIIQGHDKTHLMGSNELDSNNSTLSATFHHLWLNNMWDRCVPRLRGGNVHDYNIYVDDTDVLVARRLRDARAAALTPALRNTLNSTYSFNPPINGSIATENGAILVERSVYLDCLWPLRNNQTNPSNPIYTGKIQALDTLYTFHNADGSLVDVRGNNTDAGSPLGPFQAPVIPFSWNLPGNQLPYSYVTDDPAKLADILAAGAGAGRLNWDKQNWLKTNYEDNLSTVLITTVPADLSATVGDDVTLTVAASGLPPVSYQWKKDGILVATTDAPSLTLSAVTTAAAGTYTVTVTDRGGSLTTPAATLTVAKAVATVTLGALDARYDGTPKFASALTSPAGLPVTFTYDGTSTPPTDVGSHAVTATIEDPNYTGGASGTLVIGKGAALISLSSLLQTYDGSAKNAVVSTLPADLPVMLTYDGGNDLPINAGSYAINATIDDPRYTGSASGTLIVAKAPATVAFDHLAQRYDGSPKTAIATTAPAGLSVILTYNGSEVPPVNAGNYTVTAVVNDSNYAGQASSTLCIAKAVATVSLAPLTANYTGSPISVTATTVPSGLAVTLTYDGLSAAPVYPGTYAVAATINDPNYLGSFTDALVITPTALVRHAPVLNGMLNGSLQITSPESFALNGVVTISGDLLVRGTPTVQTNGTAILGKTENGPGETTPSNYAITLNNGVVVHCVMRRINAVELPSVAAPPPPAGTRDVFLNSSTASAGDFKTVRNLSLNSGAGTVSLPAGSYGAITANNGTALLLGTAGATTPSLYTLQSLTLNGSSTLQFAGPAIVTLANGISLNGSVGNALHPEWLTLRIASGNVVLNTGAIFHGYVVAPNGLVSLTGTSTLHGRVISDQLSIGLSAALEEPAVP